MITVYVDSGDKLEPKKVAPGDALPEGVVWVDLYRPSAAESSYIEKALNIDVPTRAEVDKIEVMSPFYQEGPVHYMTVTVLDNKLASEDNAGGGTAVTFIVMPEHLITLRYSASNSLASFVARATGRGQLLHNPEAIISGILEAFINKTADVLERVGNELDSLLGTIFEKSSSQKAICSENYNAVIRKIGYIGNLISKNRESLVSINRLLIYFGQIEDRLHLGARRENKMKFKNLTREVYSLSEYGNFLSQRNGFLLDATLGMISVEQNMIIKVFTVASAVLMPPTLIASIYGMNFKHIPELSWELGYPLAIVLIVTSALLPYFFFKKKKWL